MYPIQKLPRLVHRDFRGSNVCGADFKSSTTQQLGDGLVAQVASVIRVGGLNPFEKYYIQYSKWESSPSRGEN